MNKTIAKLGLCLMMLAGFTASAYAQEEIPEKVTMDALTIAPGEEVEVAVNYESPVDHSSFQMTIVLPEGLNYVPYEEEGEQWLFEKGTGCARSHVLNELKSERIPGGYLVVAYSTAFATLKSGGTLVKFKVKADESLAEKSEIQFKEVMFNGGQEFDFTVDVTKSQATGISEAVVAGSESEIIYNMAGQRVSGKAKGIVIKNGKKIINK